MNKITPSEMISFGWETFKKNPWIIVGVTVLVFVISAVSGSIEGALEDNGGLLALVGFLMGMAVSFLIDMGMTAFSLKAHDSVETLTVHDAWHPMPFWYYVGASLLSGIAVAIGFVLLIVPGVILALMFMFVRFLVIERGLDPIAALKESKRLTDGHKMELFVLVLMIIGINILGLLALVVGLLVSIPVSALATVHAYRALTRTSSQTAPTV